MSTHNLCFGVKIRKKVYPCKPQFYFIKVGCKGVFVTRTCFRDALRRLLCQYTWHFHLTSIGQTKKKIGAVARKGKI